MMTVTKFEGKFPSSSGRHFALFVVMKHYALLHLPCSLSGEVACCVVSLLFLVASLLVSKERNFFTLHKVNCYLVAEFGFKVL